MIDIILKIESYSHFGYKHETHNEIEERVLYNSITNTIKLILRRTNRLKTIENKSKEIKIEEKALYLRMLYVESLLYMYHYKEDKIIAANIKWIQSTSACH